MGFAGGRNERITCWLRKDGNPGKFKVGFVGRIACPLIQPGRPELSTPALILRCNHLIAAQPIRPRIGRGLINRSLTKWLAIL
jgi:hypothetical protein